MILERATQNNVHKRTLLIRELNRYTQQDNLEGLLKKKTVADLWYRIYNFKEAKNKLHLFILSIKWYKKVPPQIHTQLPENCIVDILQAHSIYRFLNDDIYFNKLPSRKKILFIKSLLGCLSAHLPHLISWESERKNCLKRYFMLIMIFFYCTINDCIIRLMLVFKVSLKPYRH